MMFPRVVRFSAGRSCRIGGNGAIAGKPNNLGLAQPQDVTQNHFGILTEAG